MPQQRCVYIMLSQTGTLFASCLRFFSNETYNHVSIAFDEELTDIYSFGRKKPRNPFIGGFVKETIHDGVYRIYQDTTCVIYELSIDERSYRHLRALISDFDREEARYRYGLLSIFAILLHIPWERRYHYVCSQFVAHLLAHSAALSFAKHPRLVTPGDFRTLLDKEAPIYAGKLCDYRQPTPAIS